ncbi:MAG TPA: hypothetical protein VGQ94_01770 [Terriglobales bacterium]|nr:hypothetical protein [Terriglobales bacterium]
MASLYEELKALVAALNEEQVPYALCGGLAMAVHGFPRATIDIDFLAPTESAERILEVGARLGFTLPTTTLQFKQGVQVRRISKPRGPDEEVLILDVLLANPPLDAAWERREQVEWEGGRIWVVSREGLVQMKSLRGSGIDVEDVAKLRTSRRSD